MGIIDGSVLTAVGELLMFGVLAQVPALIAAAKNGKSVKISKGDFSAEVTSSDDEWLLIADYWLLIIDYWLLIYTKVAAAFV